MSAVTPVAQQEAYIKPPNPGSSDHFSQSLSVSGDTMVVAAAYEDSAQTSITNGDMASNSNTKDTPYEHNQ